MEVESVEHKEVGGREALVAYMLRNYRPATRESAEMVQIVFDDGGVMFLRRGEDPGGNLSVRRVQFRIAQREHWADAWGRMGY